MIIFDFYFFDQNKSHLETTAFLCRFFEIF